MRGVIGNECAQVRQFREVYSNPSCLVSREQLGLPIAAPADPRNKYTRAVVRCRRARQSRRPILRQTRAGGVPYLLARRRRSCPSHVALFGPIRLIFVITIIAGGNRP